MRRRSSVEPSKSPQSQVLHPTLRATLESLDVQLDEELSRYRRLQSHQRLKYGRTGQRQPQPEVIAVAALDADRADRQPPSLAPSAQVAGMAVPPIKATPSTEPKTTEVLHAQPMAPVAIALNSSAPGELAISSSTNATDLSSQAAAQPLANPDELAPDDYLESSEELLRSIAEEEALRAEREPGLLESLLTPLGIGSMLLLLLSSVTFGYLIMNPSSLNSLGGQGATEGNSVTREPSSNLAPSSVGANGAAPDSLAGPSLDDPEFQSLNLDNLSSIPSSGTVRSTTANPTLPSRGASPSSATVTPNGISPAVVVPQQVPAAQSEPAAPQRTASQPVPSQRTAQQPTTPQRTAAAAQPAPRRANSNRSAPPAEPRSAARRQPTPNRQPQTSQTAASSAPTRSAAVAPPPPAQSDRYYVVTPYNSDRSLTQARQAVGDAYVRNFPSGSAQVQMGVFSERQRAQQLMQDLQRQGISAEIYEP